LTLGTIWTGDPDLVAPWKEGSKERKKGRRRDQYYYFFTPLIFFVSGVSIRLVLFFGGGALLFSTLLCAHLELGLIVSSHSMILS